MLQRVSEVISVRKVELFGEVHHLIQRFVPLLLPFHLFELCFGVRHTTNTYAQSTGGQRRRSGRGSGGRRRGGGGGGWVGFFELINGRVPQRDEFGGVDGVDEVGAECGDGPQSGDQMQVVAVHETDHTCVCCGTAHHTTAAQHSTVQHSTAQHSKREASKQSKT